MIRPPITWHRFKSAIRKVDRDSLLVSAAVTTALDTLGELPEGLRRQGLTSWNVADVARTALAWGQIRRQRVDSETLLRLSNMNFHIEDEFTEEDDSSERLARILARTFFSQFPGQRPTLPEFTRSILLFGSKAEQPEGFAPEVMTAGWFEKTAGGLTLDQYVESIFLIAVGAQQNNGTFDPDWLDGPNLQAVIDLISFEAVRRVFEEHLVSTIDDFKVANRLAQEPLPDAEKQYAFNPLADKPFIRGVTAAPLAPSVHSVIAKAHPPAIYHLGRRLHGDAFTRDLGPVFQHYTGRHLALVQGDSTVLPEINYGTRRESLDSCDWFLDLPDLLVLIECKARQPVESLRTGGSDWLNSVAGSIGKGIKQLNRSNSHIEQISTAGGGIDTKKRRVGIVVSLEPFYLNQNWLIWDKLPARDFPIGVLSVGELESLVCLNANELSLVLREAAAGSKDGVLLLNEALNAASAERRENPLLAQTWDEVGLFRRVETLAASLEQSDG